MSMDVDVQMYICRNGKFLKQSHFYESFVYHFYTSYMFQKQLVHTGENPYFFPEVLTKRMFSHLHVIKLLLCNIQHFWSTKNLADTIFIVECHLTSSFSINTTEDTGT